LEAVPGKREKLLFLFEGPGQENNTSYTRKQLKRGQETREGRDTFKKTVPRRAGVGGRIGGIRREEKKRWQGFETKRGGSNILLWKSPRDTGGEKEGSGTDPAVKGSTRKRKEEKKRDPGSRREKALPFPPALRSLKGSTKKHKGKPCRRREEKKKKKRNCLKKGKERETTTTEEEMQTPCDPGMWRRS